MNIHGVLQGRGHSGGQHGMCWFCLDCMPKRGLTNAPWEGPYCHVKGRTENLGHLGHSTAHFIRPEVAIKYCKCADKTPKEGSYGSTKDPYASLGR